MEPLSILDLFTIGIGPSSSHTVGPMRAAYSFVQKLKAEKKLDLVAQVKVQCYGSLSATGAGHGTDKALVLGLMGEEPEKVEVEGIESSFARIAESGRLLLGGEHSIAFSLKEDVDMSLLCSLPLHPNGLYFSAFNAQGELISEEVYYSIGGGFVVTEAEFSTPLVAEPKVVPYPYKTAAELISLCEETGKSIAEITWENELAFHSEEELHERLGLIWQAMQKCVKRGLSHKQNLPGMLQVKRRAPEMYKSLLKRGEALLRDPLAILDWVNLYALSVNEENAAGGRVVTAPTNGAAGIVPAVLHYATRFCYEASPRGVERFLLTAGAIGLLYKNNASISGADVGCQGEVGVACSMAAGALTEFLGGCPRQVENAAEIGMEHNLGLTCDPIGGLVQIPCIERNAMGAIKAINAARMALNGNGEHYVPLDKVMATMLETGRDMQSKYKETSQGGLAVNVVEC